MGVNKTEEATRGLEGGDSRGSWRRLQWTGEGQHHIRHHGKHHGNTGGQETKERDKGKEEEGRLPNSPCYSGNEVLLVIALTCLLNFAFILLVMACVHYCNRAVTKTDPLSRLESIVVETCSETDSEEGSSSRLMGFLSPSVSRRGSLMSLHSFARISTKTPSHSMEQLLFID